MTRRSFRAAVVQTLAELGDLDTNIERSRVQVEEAVRQGAELVVLPECMNSGYLFDSPAHCLQLAEPVDGRYGKALAQLSRRHGIHIAAGLTEMGSDGRAYNSAVLFDPRGDLIGHYRKQFLPTQDQNWFSVGDLGNPVVETALGRIGMLVCFDGRIPEIARCLAAQGAEIVIDVANFFVMGQADLWVPARACENGVWFLAATKVGVERSIYYPGGSLIVAPSGEVRARVPNDTHGVVSADIALGRGDERAWPFGGDKWADRRPPAYAAMALPFADTPLALQLEEALVPEASCVKIAAVQAHPDAQHDLAAAIEMVRHAARLGVKLLALPLHFGASVWALTSGQAAALSRQNDVLVQALQGICSEYGALAVLPTVEDSADGLAPTGLLIGSDGVIGRQRQVHLGPRERAWAAVAGDAFSVFDTPLGRIGIALGYDGLFPETTRVMALLGADIVVWPSAWEHPDERRLLAVPKAADNRIFMVCANRADAPHPGGSFVVPPTGFPHADVNLSAPRSTRWGAVMPTYANRALSRQKSMEPGVDMLRNRLPGTYGVLLADTPPVLSRER